MKILFLKRKELPEFHPIGLPPFFSMQVSEEVTIQNFESDLKKDDSIDNAAYPGEDNECEVKEPIQEETVPKETQSEDGPSGSMNLTSVSFMEKD